MMPDYLRATKTKLEVVCCGEFENSDGVLFPVTRIWPGPNYEYLGAFTQAEIDERWPIPELGGWSSTVLPTECRRRTP